MRFKLSFATLLPIAAFLLLAIFSTLTFGQYIYAGTEPSLTSFTLIHFAGYLFFLIMPVEALIPIYLFAGFSWVTIFLLSMITGMLGLAIDYWIGHLFPHERLRKFIGEKRFVKFSKYLERWGKYVIFFFGITPLSEPILVAVAGILHFNFRQAMLYSLYAMAVKYAVLILLFSLL